MSRRDRERTKREKPCSNGLTLRSKSATVHEQSARRQNGDRNDDFGGKQVYTCEVQAGADKRRANKRQRIQEVAIRKGGRNAGKNDKSQIIQFDDRRPYRRRLRRILAAAPVARHTGL